MRGRVVRAVVAALLVAAPASSALAAPAASAVASAPPSVALVQLDGTVDPLAARYVERAMAHAAARDDAAVLIRIDTPGGLESSMRAIVRAILASDVPVVCWVGPPGARAASAGAIILTGCPVAAMAPGTNVGAAHPVGFQGQIMAEKVTNDAAAFARSLAERWHRNPAWAEDAVRRSVSVSADAARRLRAVDLVEPNMASLLRAVDGRGVQVEGGRIVTLRTSGARLVPARMTPIEWIFHRAVDPNLAFLLFVLGLAGIVFEILHPGVSVPGITGGLSLLVSLVLLGMLPVNLAGLVLIVVAIGFFIAEAHVPGFGVPAALGVTSLVLGGLFLFDASVPNARVSRALIIGTALAVATLFGVVVRAVVRARREPHVAATTQTLVGEEGVVVRALEPAGIVRARNEAWSARARAGSIAQGARVRVVSVEGLTLVVEPEEGPSNREGEGP